MDTKQTHKISDEQFRESFIENDGNYTKTAKAIERKYGITYTRQSAFERALNFPDVVKQMLELREQRCEEALLGFAGDESNEIKLRTRILIDEASRISRYRMLNMRLEAAKPLQPPAEPEGYFEIGGKEFRF